MDPKLVHELALRMGEKTRVEGSALRAIVQHGDAWLATRVRTEPTAEIFVATRALDGFTLSIRWGDRWRDPDVGDRTFDGAFALETNDEALMRVWLDDESRRALLASAYTYASDDIALATMQAMVATRTWTYELENDELLVTKGGVERNADRFMIAVSTACTVAARSQRWAASYAELARKLGGHAASEVEIGGGPVITATRSAIEVGMRLVRRAHGAERLRTVVSATRIGDGRLVLAKHDPKLPDGKRFPVALDGYQLRASDERTAKKIDDTARKLVVATQPTTIVIDADSVDVWFDGALVEHGQLEPAFALVAHLAVDAIAAQGPYR